MIYKDQMMREVSLKELPSRIVSLVPSLTELLVDLGLSDKLKGITEFCIHPETIYRTKKHIGGTKKIDHPEIDLINPDLIIANKEENTKDDIESLEKKYPVWISDINTLDEAIGMIKDVGEITGKQNEASNIIKRIKGNFNSISPLPPTRSLYLIWRKPFMAAGNNTFINDMMSRCGFQNVLGKHSRYPELNESMLKDLNPELILLSSEPYPFKQKHVSEIKEIIPECHVEMVNGEYFSWYGSRLAGSPDYFNTLITKIKNRNQAATFHEN